MENSNFRFKEIAMQHSLFLPLFILLFCSIQVFGQSDFRVAFYNVENLFDTIDDPENPRDDEFTPTGRLNWTPERYQTKLSNSLLPYN